MGFLVFLFALFAAVLFLVATFGAMLRGTFVRMVIWATLSLFWGIVANWSFCGIVM